MARKIALHLPWNPREVDAFLRIARTADEAGVHSLWVNEGFGHDAFSGLALLARETRYVRLGTAIVNVFSRTPGALAQHFATLDELSEGRVMIGLGASAPGAIERFHGVPFHSPVTRLRQTVEMLRSYWRHERFDFDEDPFHVSRALPMGAQPVQPSPPIFLATLHPVSVRLTAEMADGWLPAWIPNNRVSHEVAQLREWAKAAGREEGSVTVRSPSTVTVCEDPDQLAAIRQAQRATAAFFAARNGPFYYRQFVRQGLGSAADAIRRTWDTGGAAAADGAAIGLEREFGFAGPLSACAGFIEEQAAAGIDIHTVTIVSTDAADRGRVLRALAG
jgi:alkanesulfonate monooxygenase SsuD/methylene tetrahydromethanopterin reductase-like flavin-dependent oxidoreductase (luciferase family)